MASAKLLAVRRPIVVILGATGTGKSKLALEIAQTYHGEIISADSMQCYQGLDITTNKVTASEQRLATHHMIGYASPLQSNHTVQDFAAKALPLIADLLDRNVLPIVVGGTHYYIEALLWNLLILEQSGSDNSTAIFSSNSGDCSGQKVCDNNEKSEKYEKMSTDELHQELSKVDIESAHRIHPNDRRKVLRALSVYSRHGVTMTDILKQQHNDTSDEDAVRGGLRFENTCVIWVQTEQSVLDARCDDRVDKMLEAGLIKEMTLFHSQFNESRIEGNKADYTYGLFQSIGFKEFHAYLTLTEENRTSEEGKTIFKLAVEQMKLRTRQYARKQMKWIKNRFLKRGSANVPHVYAVDATDPAQWKDQVHDPAMDIVEAYINRTLPQQLPIEVNDSFNKRKHAICDICDGPMTFTTTKDWEIHIKGRKHKSSQVRKKRLVAKIENTTEILDSSKKQLCDTLDQYISDNKRPKNDEA